MTLKGGNAPLAKVNKNSGAHQKNFNEDRPMLSAAKCRFIFQKHKVHADVRGCSMEEGRNVGH